MLITDERPVLICGVLQLLISSPLFVTVISLNVPDRNNLLQRSRLSNTPNSTNTREEQFSRLKAESVPSEFPVSPPPMSNGTNVYVPPIIYLENLVNQTDSELMVAINHAFNVSKLENRTLPNVTILTQNTLINNANNIFKFRPLPSPLSNLSASTTEKFEIKRMEDSTINRKNVNDNADPSRKDDVEKPSDQYYDFMPLILISFALAAVICLYVSLIIFRRILEKRYGSSEILLQDEYFENSDDYCYIHDYIQENSLHK